MKIEEITVNGVRLGGAEKKEKPETVDHRAAFRPCAEVRKGHGRDLMRDSAQRPAATPAR